jgi:hypothetical protein
MGSKSIIGGVLIASEAIIFYGGNDTKIQILPYDKHN